MKKYDILISNLHKKSSLCYWDRFCQYANCVHSGAEGFLWMRLLEITVAWYGLEIVWPDLYNFPANITLWLGNSRKINIHMHTTDSILEFQGTGGGSWPGILKASRILWYWQYLMSSQLITQWLPLDLALMSLISYVWLEVSGWGSWIGFPKGLKSNQKFEKERG